MQQVTVGTKYQIVIPKEIRNKVSGFKPGAGVDVQVSDDNKVVLKPITSDWFGRAQGAMKKAWKNIDPVKELDKMRDEWEEKLEEHEQTFSRS